MSNKDAEKEEMKDETHEVEDTEQDEQDAGNENDADYQQEWILLKSELFIDCFNGWISIIIHWITLNVAAPISITTFQMFQIVK